MNKRLIQRCLKGFYWLLALGGYSLITVGLPFFSRAELLPSSTWWHLALAFFFGTPMVFALLFLWGKFHVWAFNTKEVAKEEK